MLSHIQSLSFFDPAQVGSAVYYVSGYRALEQDGLQGLLRLIAASPASVRPLSSS